MAAPNYFLTWPTPGSVPERGYTQLTANDLPFSFQAAKGRNKVGARIPTHSSANTFATAGSNFTWSLALALPADVQAVQLVTYNGSASATTAVTGIASSGATKTELLNNAGVWKAATWAGASSHTIPAGSAFLPSVVLSDWITLIKTGSYTATNGLQMTMFYARIMTPLANANVGIGGFSTTIPAWATISDDQIFAWRFQSGDFVTTPTGMTGSSDPSACPLIGLRYMTQTQTVVDVAFFGDSITEGFGCTPRGFAWPHQTSVASMLNGQLMGANNLGLPGATTTQVLASANALLPIYKPQIAFFPMFSPNDSAAPAENTFETWLSNAGQFIYLCNRNGTLPVLWNGVPWTTDGTNTTAQFNLAQDALRQQATIVGQTFGTQFCNFDPALGNGAHPELWNSALLTSDGKHPNNAGNVLMIQPALAAIQTLLPVL
jgi:lysophospholipase L1-like esterase